MKASLLVGCAVVVLAGCNGERGTTSAPTTPVRAGGEVRVSVDRQAYGPGDMIAATIENQFGSPVTTFNHQSFCTILLVQRLVGSSWERVGPCPSLEPSVNVSLPAGSTVRTLPARVSQGVFPGLTDPGTYRVALVYSPGTSFSFGAADTSCSGPFDVR